MKELIFNNTNLTIINQDNQIWLKSTELAQALGYNRSDAVTKIYNRNSDEFTISMTQTPKLGERSNNGTFQGETRIFSLRGAHLIAMFSRTAIAKEFRKWVLDVLDKEVQKQPQTLTPAQKNHIKQIVKKVHTTYGTTFQAIYSQLNNNFQVAKYDEILSSQYPDACLFLRGSPNRELINGAIKIEDTVSNDYKKLIERAKNSEVHRKIGANYFDQSMNSYEKIRELFDSIQIEMNKINSYAGKIYDGLNETYVHLSLSKNELRF